MTMPRGVRGRVQGKDGPQSGARSSGCRLRGAGLKTRVSRCNSETATSTSASRATKHFLLLALLRSAMPSFPVLLSSSHSGRILHSLLTCCRAAVSPSRGCGERSGFPKPTDEPLQTHPLRPGPLASPPPGSGIRRGRCWPRGSQLGHRQDRQGGRKAMGGGGAGDRRHPEVTRDGATVRLNRKAVFRENGRMLQGT